MSQKPNILPIKGAFEFYLKKMGGAKTKDIKQTAKDYYAGAEAAFMLVASASAKLSPNEAVMLYHNIEQELGWFKTAVERGDFDAASR